jgi:hypothetical protein
MPRRAYEIRVAGTPGTAARAAPGDLGVDVEASTTLISDAVEPDELRRLLDTVRDLGLELVEIRRERPSGDENAGDPPSGALRR